LSYLKRVGNGAVQKIGGTTVARTSFREISVGTLERVRYDRYSEVRQMVEHSGRDTDDDDDY